MADTTTTRWVPSWRFLAVFVGSGLLVGHLPTTTPWIVLLVAAAVVWIACVGIIVRHGLRAGRLWLRRTPPAKAAGAVVYYLVCWAPVVWFWTHNWWWPTAVAVWLVWVSIAAIAAVAWDERCDRKAARRSLGGAR